MLAPTGDAGWLVAPPRELGAEGHPWSVELTSDDRKALGEHPGPHATGSPPAPGMTVTYPWSSRPAVERLCKNWAMSHGKTSVTTGP